MLLDFLFDWFFNGQYSFAWHKDMFSLLYHTSSIKYVDKAKTSPGWRCWVVRKFRNQNA